MAGFGIEAEGLPWKRMDEVSWGRLWDRGRGLRTDEEGGFDGEGEGCRYSLKSTSCCSSVVGGKATADKAARVPV